jgi:hypothetical protein
VFVLLLAACGGAPDPSPATPATPATPAAPPSSAAAATPDPSAAPAAASGLPPAVEEAIGRVQGLTADAGDAAIQAAFSPTFLAAVPPDKVKSLFTQLHGVIGACKDHKPVTVKDDTKAIVRLQCEHGGLNATIVVNPAPPHLIDGLLLKPAE